MIAQLSQINPDFEQLVLNVSNSTKVDMERAAESKLGTKEPKYNSHYCFGPWTLARSCGSTRASFTWTGSRTLRLWLLALGSAQESAVRGTLPSGGAVTYVQRTRLLRPDPIQYPTSMLIVLILSSIIRSLNCQRTATSHGAHGQFSTIVWSTGENKPQVSFF